MLTFREFLLSKKTQSTNIVEDDKTPKKLKDPSKVDKKPIVEQDKPESILTHSLKNISK